MEFPIYIHADLIETTTWTRFIEKASKGSHKAVEILRMAEIAFLAERLGKVTEQIWQLPEPELDALLQKFILLESPFEHPDRLFQFLHHEDCLKTPVLQRQEQFYPREFYADLWRKSLQVEHDKLVHDAALHCAKNWSWSEYRQLSEVEEEANYNSQDIVAAMLFLIISRQSSLQNKT